MTEKHKTAAAYSTKQTQHCETVLVKLLQAFGSLKHTLRLVGGLVPRYLAPEQRPDVPPHVGTTDVDVVLNVSVLAAKGTYDKLKRQLKDSGFERYRPAPDQTSSWQWVYQLDGQPIVVEFLQHTDDPEQSSKLAVIDGEDVSACQILHAGLAHEWYEEMDVRHERKDAADLVHVMRHAHPMEKLVAKFAERITSGQHGAALEQALDALERRFCDDEPTAGYLKDGPAKFASFHDVADAEERALVQRDVSGMVGHFLALLADHRLSLRTLQT
jgi:hypothetical protein